MKAPNHNECSPAKQPEVPAEFRGWWRDHKHSGWVEVLGKDRWTITPREAWRCDRYRMEYAKTLEDFYRP